MPANWFYILVDCLSIKLGEFWKEYFIIKIFGSYWKSLQSSFKMKRFDIIKMVSGDADLWGFGSLQYKVQPKSVTIGNCDVKFLHSICHKVYYHVHQYFDFQWLQEIIDRVKAYT